MSDGNDPQNPRQPKNLKGLLKFCMEATRSEDAPRSESAQPMSEDRKKWLHTAIEEMTVNPAKVMSDSLDKIEQAELDTEEGTEQQIEAVEQIQDWVDELDIAIDFIKINGLRVVPRLLSSEVSELRWRCLELLATVSQNNPYAQTAILSLKLLPAILLMIDSDPNPTVRVKSLYALSCLVRSNVEAQTKLKAHDGLSVLVRALGSEEEKVRTKATFLITALCGCESSFKDILLEKGAVEQLVLLLKTQDHSLAHEHLMSALLTLVTDHKAAQERCLKDDLDVRTFLTQRIQLLANSDEFMEEREYADKLLQILNSPSQSSPPDQGNNDMRLMLAS